MARRTNLGIGGWEVGLFDSNALDAVDCGGDMQHYLADSTSEIDKDVVFGEALLVDHLLNKLERCLAVDFGRKGLVAAIELVRIAHRRVVTDLDDVVQQLGGRPLLRLNRRSFPLLVATRDRLQ